MSETIPLLVGGLIMFVYSIAKLSETMKGAFSERSKAVIAKFTSSVIVAVLLGTVVTILLGSSSAVIIMAIVFVNAEALTFRQAIGIVMGANVGTTISSQIIAMDISKYSIVPLIIGMVIFFFAKKENWKRAGNIFLFFGLLFFSLFLMEHSAEPLKDSEAFEQWMARLENPWHGALIGGFVTLVIQSSSATVGLAITLAKQNLIDIGGGIAVMLGAELGTCSDTLIATIKGSRQAIKTGVFHLTFSLITIIAGLLLFTPFVTLVEMVTINPGVDNHIANAHVLFNLIGVLVFLPFVTSIEKLLNWLIPEKDKKGDKRVDSVS